MPYIKDMKRFGLYVILLITSAIQANTCVDNILNNKHVYMFMEATPIENGLPEPISKETVESELRKVIHNSFDENLKVHNVIVTANSYSRILIEWWSIYDDICDYPVEILFQRPVSDVYSPITDPYPLPVNVIRDSVVNTKVFTKIITGNAHPRQYEETLKIVQDYKLTPVEYSTECPKIRKNIDILSYFKSVIVRKDIEALFSFDVYEGSLININIKESNYNNGNIDLALKRYLTDNAITKPNMTAFDCKLKVKFEY